MSIFNHRSDNNTLYARSEKYYVLYNMLATIAWSCLKGSFKEEQTLTSRNKFSELNWPEWKPHLFKRSRWFSGLSISDCNWISNSQICRMWGNRKMGWKIEDTVQPRKRIDNKEYGTKWEHEGERWCPPAGVVTPSELANKIYVKQPTFRTLSSIPYHWIMSQGWWSGRWSASSTALRGRNQQH